MSKKHDIRCAQLVGVAAPGALHATSTGQILVVCGLDHWYVPNLDNGEFPNNPRVELDAFRVAGGRQDKRLLTRLGVSEFRFPPDWRTANGVANSWIALPALVFPLWRACSSCGHMKRFFKEPAFRETRCSQTNCRGVYRQVRFAAVCPKGHLQDVPWKDICCGQNSSCDEMQLFLHDSGGDLSSINVECRRCEGKKTSLGLLMRKQTGSGMDRKLSGIAEMIRKASGDDAKCQCGGFQTWHNHSMQEGCSEDMCGVLVNALNVHFARRVTSINLPAAIGGEGEALKRALENSANNSNANSFIVSARASVTLSNWSVVTSLARALLPEQSKHLSDKQIEGVVNSVFKGTPAITAHEPDTASGETSEAWHRRQERAFLTQKYDAPAAAQEKPVLVVRPETLDDGLKKAGVATLSRVTRLQHTTALCGFDRLEARGFPPSNDQELQLKVKEGLRQLFAKPDHHVPESAWLPVNIVFGEGIYLELDSKMIREWLGQKTVKDRLGEYTVKLSGSDFPIRNFYHPLTGDQWKWGAVYTLVHSLAHALMRELIFSCGYAQASLSERLYISVDEKVPMAGVLIYTASGDSEGSMGGLCSMGRGQQFQQVLARAIGRQRWCSSDPVCIEANVNAMQAGVNLAACHGCLLVPETSCETGNRVLDRATLVGTLDDPSIGFFSEYAKRLDF